MKNLKIILTMSILATIFGCVNDDDYGTPEISCVDMNATINVVDVKNIANGTPQQWVSQTDSIIEAYVTSSDEGGNFYKSISMVSLDGQYGFSMPIDQYNLFNEFGPGTKVYLNLNNRYYGIDHDGLLIGNLFNGEIGRVGIGEYKNVVYRSCEKVNEDDLVNYISISDASDDQYLNKLIEFTDVQFADSSLGSTYYDPNNTAGSGTNHDITDEFGNTIYLRVSEYANFAANMIPSGNGRIRGVLTKYNNDYQFLIRTLNDVQLTNDRLDIDLAPPLVGNSIVYNGTVNEPFTSYNTNNQNFPAYINDAAVGSRYWQVRSFSGNKYIQMTSFGGTAEANRSLFIVPVNMTAANTLSFKTKDGFNNGAVLKVYYSTDYVPGNQITTATLTDITSNFTISSGNTSGYGSTFINSGTYNIPAGITGNGYFIFEYVGNGTTGLTTTMQIDDIVIN